MNNRDYKKTRGGNRGKCLGKICCVCVCVCVGGGGGENSYIKKVGMLVENFAIDP